MYGEAEFILFTLVLARVAGLVLTAPIYGTYSVPLTIRSLLAIALSLIILPTQLSATIVCTNVADYATLLGCEALIGITLGLGTLLLLYSMSIAGELIAHTAGLSLAEIFDPTLNENLSHLSQLLFLLGICVFFCIGGHRLVMGGLLNTFQAIPLGGKLPFETLSELFTTIVSQSFALGIRIAAPMVTVLILTTIVLSFIGRTLPQINIFSLGLGLNVLLVFALLCLTLGPATWIYEDQIETTVTLILDSLCKTVK